MHTQEKIKSIFCNMTFNDEEKTVLGITVDSTSPELICIFPEDKLLTDKDRANAERVVTTWNNHDDLVRRLSVMTALCASQRHEVGDWKDGNEIILSEIKKSEALLKELTR